MSKGRGPTNKSHLPANEYQTNRDQYDNNSERYKTGDPQALRQVEGQQQREHSRKNEDNYREGVEDIFDHKAGKPGHERNPIPDQDWLGRLSHSETADGQNVADGIAHKSRSQGV